MTDHAEYLLRSLSPNGRRCRGAVGCSGMLCQGSRGGGSDFWCWEFGARE
jgi:hypothetical protein